MKEARSSVGHVREAWRLAMQVEVDSLRDNETFSIASKDELKTVPLKKILPMKMVVGTKRDSINQTEKKKARAVICGNFQEKSANEELYTANADITSVRAVLAASVPRKFDAKVIDIKTAFLNAKLPDQMETVYVRPPQALVEFGLVQPGTIWRVQKAIYGLRVSPKAWGVERDAELKRMTFKIGKETHHFQQSHIDPSVWTIVKGSVAPEGAGFLDRSVKPEDVVGYLVVYVDDFLILGAGSTINAVTETVKSKWKITDKPTLKWGSKLSVEYLSVEISAVSDGWHLSQAVYCKDLLAKWGMEECRAIGSLEDVGDEVPEEDEPSPNDVHKAQRLAGGLNWLATRTRPDISFVVSQLASAATRAPLRAIALGKRCLRYLARTRDHGIHMSSGNGSRGSGPSKLEAYGDASYEEGFAQTGVIAKLNGMTISWKSTKQPQVPRSTAESECTAMAYSSQFLEGIACLYHTMGVPITKPVLYCDNRAAVHLSTGSSEWRTKALVNRILGVRSLIELGYLDLVFMPTNDMQADALTKFMGNKLLTRQRKLVGCVPPPHMAC